MNIFRILSSYDGSINEPNISALLAYLLDPNEDHGLSDSLLKSMVPDFSKIDKDFSPYEIRIEPEYSVSYGEKRRDIDIVVQFYKESKPVYTFCIENKIRDGAIQKEQLKEELAGIQEAYKKSGYDDQNIHFCFLTLKKSAKSDSEFDDFDYSNKSHLYWKPEETQSEDSSKTIFEMIQKILEDDSKGIIDPISEEVKFLLKSFLSFIKTDFQAEEKSAKYERQDYGKPIIEFYKDFYNSMENSKEYPIDEVKTKIETTIKEENGKNPNKSTINLQLKKCIVDEKNRENLNVTINNHDKYDLFYYSDDKKKIKKFNKGNPQCEISYKGKEESE